MRRAVYIIIHRRPLPVMADSRTGHRRDGDEDDEDSRPPAAARSATAQGPEPTVRHLAKDEPAGILRQLEHESNEISTERKRSHRGTKNTSHAARRTPPYGRTPGRLARGGAEEEREWRRLRHARRFMRCGPAWTGGRGKGAQRRDGMKGCRGQSGWMETAGK